MASKSSQRHGRERQGFDTAGQGNAPGTGGGYGGGALVDGAENQQFGPPANVPNFNGVDQYVEIPPWTPRGFPYTLYINGSAPAYKASPPANVFAYFFSTKVEASFSEFAETIPDNPDFPDNGTANIGATYRDVNDLVISEKLLLTFETEKSYRAEITAYVDRVELTIVAGGARTTVVKTERTKSIDMAPVTHFGCDYINAGNWLGQLWEARCQDNSPISNTTVKATSTGQIPDMYMANGKVAFDFISDATSGFLLEEFLDITAGKFVLSADAENLMIDNVAYNNEDVVVGRHYHVEFDTTGGVLTNINSRGGMQNLVLTTAVS